MAVDPHLSGTRPHRSALPWWVSLYIIVSCLSISIDAVLRLSRKKFREGSGEQPPGERGEIGTGQHTHQEDYSGAICGRVHG